MLRGAAAAQGGMEHYYENVPTAPAFFRGVTLTPLVQLLRDTGSHLHASWCRGGGKGAWSAQ